MYIGKKPIAGNFQMCDAISVVNGQAAYTMQVGGVNVAPETALNTIVSLNGTIQKANSSYTIANSVITFSSNLATGDVIDFILILGDVLSIATPSNGTVTNAKLASGSFSNITGVGTLSSGLTLSDNILFDTASKGIYLGVTSATASNLLDDYEEGTWTPVITSGGNTLTVSGGTQFYKYIKVGKMCSLFYNAGNVTVSGTAASGDQRITGLPFAGATNGRQSGTTPMYYTSGGLRYNAKDILALSIGSGATEIEIVGYDTSSGYANPGTPSTGSGTYFWWQLTYEVA